MSRLAEDYIFQLYVSIHLLWKKKKDRETLCGIIKEWLFKLEKIMNFINQILYFKILKTWWRSWSEKRKTTKIGGNFYSHKNYSTHWIVKGNKIISKYEIILCKMVLCKVYFIMIFGNYFLYLKLLRFCDLFLLFSISKFPIYWVMLSFEMIVLVFVNFWRHIWSSTKCRARFSISSLRSSYTMSVLWIHYLTIINELVWNNFSIELV